MPGVGKRIKDLFISWGKSTYDDSIPRVLMHVKLERVTGQFKDYEPEIPYLNYGIVLAVIEDLNESKKKAAGLPGTLGNYKRLIVKFSDAVIDKLKDYGIILAQSLSIADEKFKSKKFRGKCEKCLDEIIRKCNNAEILGITFEEYKKFLDKNEIALTTAKDMLIGDLANKLRQCAKKTKDELIKVQTTGIGEFRKEIFVKDGRAEKYDDYNDKKILIKKIDDVCKTNLWTVIVNEVKNSKNKVLGVVPKAMRALGSAMEASIERCPGIEYYKFRTYLSKRPTISTIYILENYYKVLKDKYPKVLQEYKDLGRSYIAEVIEILKAYLSSLKNLSNPKLIDLEKLAIRQNLKDLLDHLQRILDAILNDDRITKVYIPWEKRKVEIKGNGEDFGLEDRNDKESGRSILIDGWTLTDFLGPMKAMVDRTLNSINSLVKTENSTVTVDYETLEIKNPDEKKSTDVSQAKDTSVYTSIKEKASKEAAFQKQEESKHKQKVDKIAKERKFLVELLEKGMSIFVKATRKVHEVEYYVREDTVANTECQKRYNNISSNYGKLLKGYRTFSDPEYVFGGETYKIRLIGKVGVIQANLDFFNPSRKNPLKPDDILSAFQSMGAYCLRYLSQMKELAEKINQDSKYLISTYSSTSKSTLENRPKLTKLLQKIIDAKNAACDKYEDTLDKFNNMYFALSVKRRSEYTGLEKQITALKGSLDGQYGDVCRGALAETGEKYELIENDKILLGNIKTYKENILPDLIKFCGDRLNDINKISKDMDTLEKEFIKEFSGDLSEVEKARTTAAKLLGEMFELQEEALRIESSANSYDGKNEYFSYVNYPSLEVLYKNFKTKFEEAQKANVSDLLEKIKASNIGEIKAKGITNYIKGLKLENLTNFNSVAPSVLKQFKASNKELSKDVDAMKKEVGSQGKDYGRKQEELSKLLHRIIDAKASAINKCDAVIKRFKEVSKAFGHDDEFEYWTEKVELDKKIESIKDNYKLACKCAKYGTEGEIVFELIDDVGQVNEDKIGVLNIELLKTTIDSCNTYLKDIENTAADIDKAIKDLLKRFGAIADNIEKSRSETVKILEEANELWQKVDKIFRELEIVYNNNRGIEGALDYTNIVTGARFDRGEALLRYSKIINFIAKDETQKIDTSEVPTTPLNNYTTEINTRREKLNTFLNGVDFNTAVLGLKLDKLEGIIAQSKESLPELRKRAKNIKSIFDKNWKKMASLSSDRGNVALEVFNIIQKIAEFKNWVTDTLEERFCPKIGKCDDLGYSSYLNDYVQNCSKIDEKFEGAKVYEFGEKTWDLFESREENKENGRKVTHYEASWDNILRIVQAGESRQNVKNLKNHIKSLNDVYKQLQKCKKPFEKDLQKFEKLYNDKVSKLKELAGKLAGIFTSVEQRLDESSSKITNLFPLPAADGVDDAYSKLNELEIKYSKSTPNILSSTSVYDTRNNSVRLIGFNVNTQTISGYNFKELGEKIEECNGDITQSNKYKQTLDDYLEQFKKNLGNTIIKIKEQLQEIIEIWIKAIKFFESKKSSDEAILPAFATLDEATRLRETTQEIEYLSYDEKENIFTMKPDIEKILSSMDSNGIAILIRTLEDKYRSIKRLEAKFEEALNNRIGNNRKMNEETEKRNELRDKVKQIIDIFERVEGQWDAIKVNKDIANEPKRTLANCFDEIKSRIDTLKKDKYITEDASSGKCQVEESVINTLDIETLEEALEKYEAYTKTCLEREKQIDSLLKECRSDYDTKYEKLKNQLNSVIAVWERLCQVMRDRNLKIEGLKGTHFDGIRNRFSEIKSMVEGVNCFTEKDNVFKVSYRALSSLGSVELTQKTEEVGEKLGSLNKAVNQFIERMDIRDRIQQMRDEMLRIFKDAEEKVVKVAEELVPFAEMAEMPAGDILPEKIKDSFIKIIETMREQSAFGRKEGNESIGKIFPDYKAFCQDDEMLNYMIGVVFSDQFNNMTSNIDQDLKKISDAKKDLDEAVTLWNKEFAKIKAVIVSRKKQDAELYVKAAILSQQLMFIRDTVRTYKNTYLKKRKDLEVQQYINCEAFDKEFENKREQWGALFKKDDFSDLVKMIWEAKDLSEISTGELTRFITQGSEVLKNVRRFANEFQRWLIITLKKMNWLIPANLDPAKTLGEFLHGFVKLNEEVTAKKVQFENHLGALKYILEQSLLTDSGDVKQKLEDVEKVYKGASNQYDEGFKTFNGTYGEEFRRNNKSVIDKKPDEIYNDFVKNAYGNFMRIIRERDHELFEINDLISKYLLENFIIPWERRINKVVSEYTKPKKNKSAVVDVAGDESFNKKIELLNESIKKLRSLSTYSRVNASPNYNSMLDDAKKFIDVYRNEEDNLIKTFNLLRNIDDSERTRSPLPSTKRPIKPTIKRRKIKVNLSRKKRT